MKNHTLAKRISAYALSFVATVLLSGCGTAIAMTFSRSTVGTVPAHDRPIGSRLTANPQSVALYQEPLGRHTTSLQQRTYRAYPPAGEARPGLLPAPPLPGSRRRHGTVATVLPQDARTKTAPDARVQERSARANGRRPGSAAGSPDGATRGSRRQAEPAAGDPSGKSTGGKPSRARFVHQQWPGLPGYVVIQPNVAYGHQPEAVGLRWLKRRGFTTVLDLRSDPDPAEAPLLRQLGLSYVNIPLKPDEIWTDADYARIKEVLSQPQYRPLFIHDQAGERFGAVWLTFRVRESALSLDAALKEVAALKLPTDGRLFRRALEALEDSRERSGGNAVR